MDGWPHEGTQTQLLKQSLHIDVNHGGDSILGILCPALFFSFLHFPKFFSFLHFLSMLANDLLLPKEYFLHCLHNNLGSQLNNRRSSRIIACYFPPIRFRDLQRYIELSFCCRDRSMC